MLRFIDARHRRTQNARQFLRIWPCRRRRFLRLAQVRRGDELHRARNLLGVLHRADAAPEIEKCRHRCSLKDRSVRLHSYFAVAATAAVKRSLKLSTAFLISALMPSSRAFFSAIFFRIDGLLVSTYWRNSFSKRLTSGTGILSIAPLVATKRLSTCFSTGSGTY